MPTENIDLPKLVQSPRYPSIAMFAGTISNANNDAYVNIPLANFSKPIKSIIVQVNGSAGVSNMMMDNTKPLNRNVAAVRLGYDMVVGKYDSPSDSQRLQPMSDSVVDGYKVSQYPPVIIMDSTNKAIKLSVNDAAKLTVYGDIDLVNESINYKYSANAYPTNRSASDLLQSELINRTSLQPFSIVAKYNVYGFDDLRKYGATLKKMTNDYETRNHGAINPVMLRLAIKLEAQKGEKSLYCDFVNEQYNNIKNNKLPGWNWLSLLQDYSNVNWVDPDPIPWHHNPKPSYTTVESYVSPNSPINKTYNDIKPCYDVNIDAAIVPATYKVFVIS
ncbi:hypothetical protein [Photobacterium leiognathi]|uniref:hypothetical protein n=1 Tax=Photobacterium leiognathi TaxID=553611 RepID=UPI002981164C|nr:hypothetical protein [Photobacterium leiognathi]